MRRNKYDSAILQRAYNEGYDHGSESLRDHFAGLAMQKMLVDSFNPHDSKHTQHMCNLSYNIADQMMEARNDR